LSTFFAGGVGEADKAGFELRALYSAGTLPFEPCPCSFRSGYFLDRVLLLCLDLPGPVSRVAGMTGAQQPLVEMRS
jgi:hypothetical protein